MQFNRLRTIGSLAFGGGMIALALTGCNVNASASGSSNSPGSSSGSAAPAPSTSPTSDSTNSTGGKGREQATSTSQGNTPTCLAADMHADLLVQNSTEQGEIATLALTHMTHTGHSCLIPAGWAPIGTGGPNNYTPLPATRTNYPGTGKNITLPAGQTVYAGMKWHTGTDCGTTTGLGVAWGNSWIPITYHGLNGQKPPICDSLVLGTIQPTMDGVNFT